jgi:hypothetical protein
MDRPTEERRLGRWSVLSRLISRGRAFCDDLPGDLHVESPVNRRSGYSAKHGFDLGNRVLALVV